MSQGRGRGFKWSQTSGRKGEREGKRGGSGRSAAGGWKGCPGGLSRAQHRTLLEGVTYI